MGDFLQLKVKRRQRIDGFLDILKEENQAYKNDPENTGNRLREKLGTWLMESDIFSPGGSSFTRSSP